MTNADQNDSNTASARMRRAIGPIERAAPATVDHGWTMSWQLKAAGRAAMQVIRAPQVDPVRR